MENEPYENILVRTEELDWMGQEGELETNLRKAMRHLEQVVARGEITMSKVLSDIAGLWFDEELNACESYELAGSANTAISWPARFEPPTASTVTLPGKKPW